LPVNSEEGQYREFQGIPCTIEPPTGQGWREGRAISSRYHVSLENRILSDTMMGGETPIPPVMIVTAAPDGASCAAAFINGSFTIPVICPAVPREGP
jgi:hypothetical protein